MDLIVWCNRIIRGSFLALFILIPLILTPWNYELFEFNKMIVTYGLTIIIMTAWITKMMIERQIKIKRTILDLPILLFVASQLISSLFSMDPHVSWFGYYSRFNGGMLSIFSYVLLYYAFVNNWFDHDDTEQDRAKRTNMLLYVTLGTGVVVALYGVLEHFGIDKHLWVQDVQNRVFSTLGQPNWLAAYLVALIPISVALSMRSFRNRFTPPFLLWTSVSVLFFIALLFTRSRSGLAGLAVAEITLLIGAFVFTKDRWSLLLPAGLIHLLFFLIVFFNGTHVAQIDKYLTLSGLSSIMQSQEKKPLTAEAEPQQSGTLLEYGGTESGKIRSFVWQAAVTAWRATQKTFLIGTGTETFAFAFFQYKPAEHNLTSEWDFLYNKAHNEYLNYLATTGIFGLGSYLLLLGLFIVWFLKQTTSHAHTPQPATYNLQPIALFSGWISILITNFFGFSVVIMQVFLFLFPALIFVSLAKHDRHLLFSLARIPSAAAKSIVIITMGIATIGIGFVITMWIGDMTFAKGYRQSRSGLIADAYRTLTQATILRPQEPMYYDELGVVLAGLSVASMEAQDVTAAATFAQQSLAASDRALAISPNNVNFWKSRTKIYFGFSNVDPKFVAAALTALEKAFSLSPTDPKIAYNLAVLHSSLGENEKAIEILKQTIALKPNYRDAYYGLYVFYIQVKQPNLAHAALEEYLKKVDPNDQDFQEKLKQ